VAADGVVALVYGSAHQRAMRRALLENYYAIGHSSADNVAPRDPSLATPETRGPEAEMRIGLVSGRIKIVISYQH